MLFKLLEEYSFPDKFDSTFHNLPPQKKGEGEQKGSINYSLFNMQHN